jgi:BMFP domain-containing protein YqiC
MTGAICASAKDEDDKKLAKTPMSQLDLLTWEKDVINPILATYRHRLDEAMTCIRTLEGRVLELEASLAARSEVPNVER